MKGILFNHLEELTTTVLSAGAWTKLREELPAQTRETYAPGQTYPDADLFTLVEGLARHAKLPIEDIWKRFGKLSIPAFMRKYPAIVSHYKTPKEILSQINYMHFTEVRNLFTDTELPYFLPVRSDASTMVIRYISKRRMCFYFEGALQGLSEFYQSPINFRQSECIHHTGKFCDFQISW